MKWIVIVFCIEISKAVSLKAMLPKKKHGSCHMHITIEIYNIVEKIAGGLYLICSIKFTGSKHTHQLIS